MQGKEDYYHNIVMNSFVVLMIRLNFNVPSTTIRLAAKVVSTVHDAIQHLAARKRIVESSPNKEIALKTVRRFSWCSALGGVIVGLVALMMTMFALETLAAFLNDGKHPFKQGFHWTGAGVLFLYAISAGYIRPRLSGIEDGIDLFKRSCAGAAIGAIASVVLCLVIAICGTMLALIFSGPGGVEAFQQSEQFAFVGTVLMAPLTVPAGTVAGVYATFHP